MKSEGGSQKTAFRVLNNTLAFIGGEFFYHFVNFLAGILIARSLGSENYGQFSFVFAYLSFFEVFVQFGLNSILTRELSQPKADAPRILGNAILLRLVFVGCAFPLALLLIRLLGYPLSVQHGVLVASFQLFLTLRSLYETVFRVRLAMIYPALVNGLRALINLGWVAGVASLRPTVIQFILAYLGSGLIGLAAIAFFARRFVRITLQWDWNLMRGLIKESFPLLFSSTLTLLYYRVDIFMLSLMKGFREVGYYSVATRLTESLDIVSTALMISLFPLLSRAFKEDRKEFEKLLSKAWKWLLLLGFPMAIGGSLVAGDLMVFLFGEEYTRSGVTLGILFWYTFFGFFSTLLVNLLIVCGRQVVDAWISFFLVLGNIGANFLLIPLYSYNGAAAATVLTEILGTSVMLVYSARYPTIRLPLPLRELWKALKVNAVFLPILLFVKIFFQIPVMGFILLGGVIYASLLLGMRLVSFKEIKNYLSHGMKRVSGVSS